MLQRSALRWAGAPGEKAAMFRNREDAGLRLAAALRGRPLHDPVVLAIPRGGVAVGAVLARQLGAKLDVFLARKLRAPRQPELALGAVAEGGEVQLNLKALDALGMTEADLEPERRQQEAEMRRLQQLYRGGRPAAPVTGRSVLVTDDGLATGATLLASLRALLAHSPRELIVAVPVASPRQLEKIRPWCSDAICLLSPEDFQAVSPFYVDFKQVDDDEVRALLQSAADAT